MKVKELCLSLLCFTITTNVNAQDIPNTFTSSNFCSQDELSEVDKNSECHLSSANENEKNLVVAQRRRTRSSRSANQKTIQGYYAGISGGAFLSPDPLGGQIDLNTGYGGSVFGGVKFPKNLSAEAEFLFAFGGVDSTGDLSGLQFDGDYNSLGLMVNGRYDFILSDENNFSLFVSPGIGFIRASQNVDLSSGDEEFAGLGTLSSLDTSTTTLGFQLKAGASIPFNERLRGLAQGRYITNGFSTLSLEGGVSYSF